MRQASLDVPSLEPRRRMGLVRNQVTEHMYRVTIDNATITGVTFDPSAIVRGARVQVVWHPERNFWEIEQIGPVIPPIPRSGFVMQFYQENDGQAAVSYDGGLTWPDFFLVFAPGGNGEETEDLYYDRWNGNGQRNRVHFMLQSGNDGLYYNYADLGSGTPVFGSAIDLGINYAPLNVKGSSIIVTPNGRIRIDGFSVGSGPLGGRSHYSDDGVTFSAALGATARPMEAQQDRMIGWHDRSTGNDDDIIYLYADESANQLSVKRGTAVGGALTETTIPGTFNWTSLSGGQHWASTMDSNGDGHISLIAWDSDVLATSKSLKAFDIYGATITARTDVITNETYVNCAAITRFPEELGGGLRAFYTKDSATASNAVEIYYKDSPDEMVTWGPETLWSAHPTAAGIRIAKLAIDPLPGIGPVGDEAPVWWLEPSAGSGVVSRIWQSVDGTAIESSPTASIEDSRENAGTTRGQVAWITVP
jgi:hypothetical protein